MTGVRLENKSAANLQTAYFNHANRGANSHAHGQVQTLASRALNVSPPGTTARSGDSPIAMTVKLAAGALWRDIQRARSPRPSFVDTERDA